MGSGGGRMTNGTRGAGFVVAATLGLALVGVPATTSSPASAADATATTVCYDASQAGRFASTADEAAGIWNDRTNNLDMSACGTAVRIYVTDSGGSRAYVEGLGR